MTDSQFLYQLMLRVNDARATAATPAHPSMADLLGVTTALQRALESGADADRLRDEALDIATIALRLSVEVFNRSK